MTRETLAERRARAEAGLKATGFTKGKEGLWTRGNQTARIVKSEATHNGGPVPDTIEVNGKTITVHPIYREPKITIEYGEAAGLQK